MKTKLLKRLRKQSKECIQLRYIKGSLNVVQPNMRYEVDLSLHCAIEELNRLRRDFVMQCVKDMRIEKQERQWNDILKSI